MPIPIGREADFRFKRIGKGTGKSEQLMRKNDLGKGIKQVVARHRIPARFVKGYLISRHRHTARASMRRSSPLSCSETLAVSADEGGTALYNFWMSRTIFGMIATTMAVTKVALIPS